MIRLHADRSGIRNPPVSGRRSGRHFDLEDVPLTRLRLKVLVLVQGDLQELRIRLDVKELQRFAERADEDRQFRRLSLVRLRLAEINERLTGIPVGTDDAEGADPVSRDRQFERFDVFEIRRDRERLGEASDGNPGF